MVLPMVIGLICGVAGFLPLLGAISGVRRVTSTSNFSHLSILLLAVAGSIAVLLIATFICISVARDNVFWFVIAEAIGLVASAIIFGVKTFIVRRNKH